MGYLKKSNLKNGDNEVELEFIWSIKSQASGADRGWRWIITIDLTAINKEYKKPNHKMTTRRRCIILLQMT